MKRLAILPILGALLATCAARPEKKPANEPAKNPAKEVRRPLDPLIEQLLRKTSAHLQAAKQFRFHAEVAFDKIEIKDDEAGSEIKVQYGATVDISVKRRNKLRVSFRGDLVQRDFWDDGKTATLLAPAENYYGQIAVSGGIDGALAKIEEKAGFVPPLTDLVHSDPYARLVPNIRDASYLGLHTAAGVRCHHLLLHQEFVDWQIWIEASDNPVPRKLVITYKKIPGWPQYRATMTKWEFADIPDEAFTFEAPAGAIKVDMIPTKVLGRK